MKTKLTFLLSLTFLFLFLGGIAFADDYQDAKDAYERKDYKEAVRLYRLSAEQGNANAQFLLGFMYYQGKGVLLDYKEAAKWYRLSAEQGDAIAQCNLGGMYNEGKGVPQDYKEAVKWWKLAAEQQDEQAQFILERMHGNSSN